jgi:hypothetical protein
LKRLVKDLEKPISSDIIQLELITFCWWKNESEKFENFHNS